MYAVKLLLSLFTFSFRSHWSAAPFKTVLAPIFSLVLFFFLWFDFAFLSFGFFSPFSPFRHHTLHTEVLLRNLFAMTKTTHRCTRMLPIIMILQFFLYAFSLKNNQLFIHNLKYLKKKVKSIYNWKYLYKYIEIFHMIHYQK